MKFAFISDIHGNAIALDAVLDDINKKGIDKIYVLGDICYRGPEPKRSLELVQSLNTEVIRGNADEWVVRGVREGEVPAKVLALMNSERDWTLTKLNQTDIDYLQNLPDQIHCEAEGIKINAFHATPDSLFEVVLPETEDQLIESKLMKENDCDIFIYGHIHKPYIRYINGKVVMNIGSVGLPFDGMAKASYGLVEIENGHIRTAIQRVKYNLDTVVDLYKKENYPNAEMMSAIIRNGKI